MLWWDGRRRLHSESSFIPRNLVLLLTLFFFFCCGCFCCCCYSVYLSICRVRVRECVRECECVLGMCGRLSGYQRWHKSFIYQPQLVLLAGVLGAPCLMNTHKVANEATSRKSGKGSADTHPYGAHTFAYTYICMFSWLAYMNIYIRLHSFWIRLTDWIMTPWRESDEFLTWLNDISRN